MPTSDGKPGLLLMLPRRASGPDHGASAGTQHRLSHRFSGVRFAPIIAKATGKQCGVPFHKSGVPFHKGQSGNPAGTRAGSKHRITKLAAALLDGEAEALIRKAIEMALAGDAVALRLCLERILPPRKEVPIRQRLPALENAADVPRVLAAILKAATAGALTVGEASELRRIVQS
jgi:hypothetical protein